MSRRLASIADAVGNTPLVRLSRLTQNLPHASIYLKLEYMNPGGSVKDRPALQMMRDAIEDGRLTPNKTLIDSTSGNTGVAYSLFGAALGVRVALVMPENVSVARKSIARAYGTEIIFSDPMEGSDGAIRLAQKLVDENSGKYFYPDQYSNPSNPRAHYLGTGREIIEQMGDRITHFVAGLGTSGTMMGTARRLHQHARRIHCIAVEPEDALHGLEGMKHMASSIVPAIYDASLPDENMPMGTEEGWDMSERLLREEGLFVGHSTGANVAAALRVVKRDPTACVVTLACDRGDRYFPAMKWERTK